MNSSEAKTGTTSSSHHKLGDRKNGLDKAPSTVDRQDSDDGSLGAMAKAVAAERENHAIDLDLLPPAPMLWAENDVGPTSNIVDSPVRKSNRKYNTSHNDINMSGNGNYHYYDPSRSPHRSPQSTTSKSKISRGKKKKKGSSIKSNGARALHYGNEDYTESVYSDSFGHDSDASKVFDDHSHSRRGKHHKNATCCENMWWSWRLLRAKSLPSHNQQFSLVHLVQALLLLFLGLYVYDSHTKVQSHKDQLREYDEERSHILEQMMWIDKAAKKVHKKYTEKEMLDAAMGNLGDAGDSSVLKEALENAENELDLLHHNIQLNARQHLAVTFGEGPAEVSLQISENSHILIGLSDDTPHAISTLIQQVNKHTWDQVEVRDDPIDSAVASEENKKTPELLTSSRVQLTAKPPNDPSVSGAGSSPVLEFVERSHGCRDPGSVSLRQQQKVAAMSADQDGELVDETQSLFLVLTVNLDAREQPLPKGDVCIGRVLQGLDKLVQMHIKHRKKLSA